MEAFFVVLWIYLQQHKEAQKNWSKLCKAKLLGIMEIPFIVIVTLHGSYSSVSSQFFLYFVYNTIFVFPFWGGYKTIKGRKKKQFMIFAWSALKFMIYLSKQTNLKHEKHTKRNNTACRYMK